MKVVRIGALAVLLMLLGSTAQAGIGIHIGMDMTTIDSADEMFKFEEDPAIVPQSRILRDESGQPFNVGLDIGFNMIPLIDLQISLEAAFANYSGEFDPGQPPGANFVGLEQENIPYLRAGTDVSVMLNLPFLSFPPVVPVVKGYFGAGPSLQAFGPVLSSELFTDKYQTTEEAAEKADLVELAQEIDIRVGFHGVLGARIKPPAFPLAFKIQGKYYVFANAAEATPQNFLVVQGGFEFGLF